MKTSQRPEDAVTAEQVRCSHNLHEIGTDSNPRICRFQKMTDPHHHKPRQKATIVSVQSVVESQQDKEKAEQETLKTATMDLVLPDSLSLRIPKTYPVPSGLREHDAPDWLDTIFHTRDIVIMRECCEQMYNDVLKTYPHMNGSDLMQWNVLRRLKLQVNISRDLLHYFIFVCLWDDANPLVDHCRRNCIPERIEPFLFHLRLQKDWLLSASQLTDPSAEQPRKPATSSAATTAVRLPQNRKYPTFMHFVWAMREMYFTHYDDFGNARVAYEPK